MKEKIVVITLNYNQNDYSTKCINSLIDTTYKNFNILLVDNGSTEENYLKLKRDLIKDPRVILKRIEQNRGYIGGTNFGLEEGIKLNPDYFLIMNNDTFIDKYAISELVSTIKKYENKAIVTGKVYYYDKPNTFQDLGSLLKDKRYLYYEIIGKNEIDNKQFDKESERDMIDDIFWLMPTALYLEIGGYSQYFWFNSEQADFALRAKKKGYKLIYTPNAKLWHEGSASIGGKVYNPNKAYWTVQSSLILRYLHLKKSDFFYYYLKTILSILRTFIKSLYYKISGKQDITTYAKAKFLGWIYFNKWVIKKNINTGIIPFNK